jgi:hypothetical protein
MSEKEENDKIIVYTSFHSAVDANIPKTKLDAYGIPCFLSDEHLVGLHIFTYQSLGTVRLHIFEADTQRVKEILEEQAE